MKSENKKSAHYSGTANEDSFENLRLRIRVKKRVFFQRAIEWKETSDFLRRPLSHAVKRNQDRVVASCREVKNNQGRKKYLYECVSENVCT